MSPERLGIRLGSLMVLIASASAVQPYFVVPLTNLTVAEGKSATFTCTVRHLGGHKVAWIKSDSKAILAIHDVAITHVDRLHVRHEHATWTLTLNDVRRSDSGPYMCQVNTEPMHYQVGMLEVVIPPDIIASETSSDVVVPEGGSVRLQCRASGHPKPTITWSREDRQKIVVRSRRKMKVSIFSGDVLHLHGVTRSDMGVYLCIANNGIPPPISQRIMVSVSFAPMIETEGVMLTAPLGSRVTIVCQIEAFPRPIFYWSKHDDEMILSGSRHATEERQVSLYSYNMTLNMPTISRQDYGSYHCVAKNSIGETEATILLHEPDIPDKEQQHTEPPTPHLPQSINKRQQSYIDHVTRSREHLDWSEPGQSQRDSRQQAAAAAGHTSTCLYTTLPALVILLATFVQMLQQLAIGQLIY